jgi:hypothetical protein
MHVSTSSCATPVNFKDIIQGSIREPELSFCFRFFVLVLQMLLEALNLRLAIYILPDWISAWKFVPLRSQRQWKLRKIRQGLKCTAAGNKRCHKQSKKICIKWLVMHVLEPKDFKWTSFQLWNLSYSDLAFISIPEVKLPILVLFKKMSINLEFLVRNIWNFLVHVFHDTPRRRYPIFKWKRTRQVIRCMTKFITDDLSCSNLKPCDRICQAKAQTSSLALCKEVISCREATDCAYMVARFAAFVKY